MHGSDTYHCVCVCAHTSTLKHGKSYPASWGIETSEVCVQCVKQHTVMSYFQTNQVILKGKYNLQRQLIIPEYSTAGLHHPFPSIECQSATLL
jgi:homoaconitase/3-isopropylmalate dehydratase large subunit